MGMRTHSPQTVQVTKRIRWTRQTSVSRLMRIRGCTRLFSRTRSWVYKILISYMEEPWMMTSWIHSEASKDPSLLVWHLLLLTMYCDSPMQISREIPLDKVRHSMFLLSQVSMRNNFWQPPTSSRGRSQKYLLRSLMPLPSRMISIWTLWTGRPQICLQSALARACTSGQQLRARSRNYTTLGKMTQWQVSSGPTVETIWPSGPILAYFKSGTLTREN